MTDAFTDDLFSTKISIIKHTIVYPVSRLVVDPERFIDDDKEVMSKKGNCVKLFQQMGYSIKMNGPFSGSIAPKNYYQQNRNAFSIMIEINRRLYMNEKTGMKNERYEALKSNISKAIKSIKDFK
jgi:N-formylglutamate amidohydrolase